MKPAVKHAVKHVVEDWDACLEVIRRMTAIETEMDYAAREKRRLYLEARPLVWMKEMFSGYARYEFAGFQEKAIRRILSHQENWYEVLSWARGLAKSTIVMFIVTYLVLTGKKKNIILVSNSYENAVKLISVYRGQLEANERIRFYYGRQCGAKWKEDHFITRGGVSFMALGAGQSPRGNKNEAVRPDCLLMDDFDTDEECRNREIIKRKWEWFEQALYFTRDVSEPLLTVFCGNIIARDCCVVRAGNKAGELATLTPPLGHWDIINLRMANINHPNPKEDYARGTSVWPEKNTEEAINSALAQVSAASAQKECFNNPVSEGSVFKEIRWGKVPPPGRFKFLVAYGDPAPGENRGKNSSFKGVGLVGKTGDTYYVIKVFLDRELNAVFMGWYFALHTWVGGRTAVYHCIENNSLQDPFFRQVFLRILGEERKKRGIDISIHPDSEKKADKATRIEANLEPLNREGRLIFNEAEKNDPHMKRLVEQFELFNLQLAFPADGPDLIEGAKRIIDRKTERREGVTALSRRDLRMTDRRL
jgi:hypothetical protein